MIKSNNVKYQCDYCEYSCFKQSVVKHIYSHHLEKCKTAEKCYFPIAEDTLSELKEYGNVIGTFMTQGKPIDRKCKIKYNGGVDYYCCFGCNLFWNRPTLAQKHYGSCKNWKLHNEMLAKGDKSVKEVDNEKPIKAVASVAPVEKVVERVVEKVVENTDEIAKLKKHIQLLEKQNKQLKSDMEDNIDKAIKWDMVSQAIVGYCSQFQRLQFSHICQDMYETLPEDAKGQEEIDFFGELCAEIDVKPEGKLETYKSVQQEENEEDYHKSNSISDDEYNQEENQEEDW